MKRKREWAITEQWNRKERFAAVLAVFLLVCCLAGCGGKKAETQEGQSETPTAVQVLKDKGFKDPVEVFSVTPKGQGGGERDIPDYVKELGFAKMADTVYSFETPEDTITAYDDYLAYLDSEGLSGEDPDAKSIVYNDDIYINLYTAQGTNKETGDKFYSLFIKVAYK